MLRDLRSSAIAVVLITLVFGLGIPALFTGFAQLAFPNRADGSLIKVDGKVVGSKLAAQGFKKPEYFHPRPSATAPAYNAGATTFANLGPTNPDLAKNVKAAAQAILKLESTLQPRPEDRRYPGGRRYDIRRRGLTQTFRPQTRGSSPGASRPSATSRSTRSTG